MSVAGRIGPHRESHEPRLLLTQFLTTKSAPVEWDGTHGITDWGIDGNGDWGDCGAAATDHGNMAKAGNVALLDTLGRPQFNGTLGTYWAYGIAQGEVGQPPNAPNQPDEGVDNRTWLGFLYKHGIIDGYGEVPLGQLHRFAMQFDGVLLSVQLSDKAQEQFNNGVPWGQPGDTPDPSLGHDVWYIAYSADGSAKVITWGQAFPVTQDFMQNFVTDAWAILDKNDPRIDWTPLRAALESIHGTVDATPAPAPSPSIEQDAIHEIEAILHMVEGAGGRIAHVIGNLFERRGAT